MRSGGANAAYGYQSGARLRAEPQHGAVLRIVGPAEGIPEERGQLPGLRRQGTPTLTPALCVPRYGFEARRHSPPPRQARKRRGRRFAAPAGGDRGRNTAAARTPAFDRPAAERHRSIQENDDGYKRK